ncbi:MAG: YifB family Mg chelatase-like AAA ATPase [Solirubrobacterales bacterium]
MLSTIQSFTLEGIAAKAVRIEVDVHRGLPGFAIVGLPDAAVRETRERVRAAIVNSGFEFPLWRIVVNLAPASLRSASPGLDLAIAAALLAASGQVDADHLASFAFLGELGLDGSVRTTAGALPAAEAAREAGRAGIVVAGESGPEAALAEGIDVVPVETLAQLPQIDVQRRPAAPAPAAFAPELGPNAPDLADLRGQPQLHRALEVAAAGSHSLLMVGAAGSGKSLAAARLPGILPPLSRTEALEVARVASPSGRFAAGVPYGRPFRAPHHTISAAGLLGGGRPPCAGELTLAHRGVLFLDHLADFRRDALAELRPVLECGSVCIRKGPRSLILPARVLVVAAAEGCPCGRGPADPECPCNPAAVSRYRERLTQTPPAPFDLTIPVEPPSAAEIAEPRGEESARVRERVSAARAAQESRLGVGRCNARMSFAELRACGLDRKASLLLSRDGDPHALAPAVRLARTIADLQGDELVAGAHIAEALGLRSAARL